MGGKGGGGGGSVLEETLSELVGVLERASLKMNFIQVRNVHCNFIRLDIKGGMLRPCGPFKHVKTFFVDKM